MIPTDELEDYPKRTSVQRAIPYVIAIALIGAIAYGIARPAGNPSGAGDEMPEFSLEYLDGSGVFSSEDLAGHPVVLNIWASWCLPCREEAPLLERKWREYKDQGVRFVGVVIKDNPESALSFIERFDVTYPMVFDPDQTLARDLGLVGLPQTFFIDANGRFIASSASDVTGSSQEIAILGAIEEEELDRQIAVLLGSTP